MAKLQRVTGKVFANSAPLNQIGQFGSALAGNPTNTQDVATIQALSAYLNGWGSGVVTSRNFPPIEEVNGVLKTISYQACYLLQEGIPEYDINTEYSNTSVVKSISGNELIFYISLADNNIGNSLTDTDYWTRAVFIGTSAIGVPQFTLNFNLVNAPENCIWLDGAVKKKIDYPALYAIYGDNYRISGTVVEDDEFQLPDFRNRVIWGGTTAGYLSAGLPELMGSINGSRSFYWAGSYNVDGVFDVSTAKGAHADAQVSGSNPKSVIFRASKYNTIYGNSTTVQPPAIKVRVYTRYQ